MANPQLPVIFTSYPYFEGSSLSIMSRNYPFQGEHQSLPKYAEVPHKDCQAWAQKKFIFIFIYFLLKK